VPTTEANALIGWMEEAEAVDFLTRQCAFDPALTVKDAKALWQPFRTLVDQLPPREYSSPKKKQMKPEERDWERQFLSFSRAAGANVKSVVKVNLFDLLVHQKWIMADRVAAYQKQLTSGKEWMSRCLPIKAETFNFQVTVRNLGLSTEVDMDIPDGEWLMTPVKCNAEFHLRPGPALRYVTVTPLDKDRLLLWAGYHRAYAWALRAHGDGEDCPALVALAENLVLPPTQGNATAFDRLVRGERAPVFGDFFDERFFVKVPLRLRRYQLQIRSNIVQTDIS